MREISITLPDLIRQRKCQYTCEVGVLRGKMSKRILEQCDSIEHHRMIDPWQAYEDINQYDSSDKRLLAYTQNEWENVRSDCLKAIEKYSSKTIIHRCTSKEGSCRIGGAFLDCVIIDADHSYEPYLNDIISWLPKIEDGGIFVSHDYSRGWPDIVRASNEVFGDDITRIDGCYIYIEINECNRQLYIDRATELLKKA